MLCSRCGNELAASSQFCPNCGQAIPQGGSQAALSGAAPAPAIAGQGAPHTDPKAITSMVLGMLSISILLSVFAGIPAVILGHLSKASIRRSNGRLKGEGMATAGLIMGYISLFLLPVFAGVVFVAVPNLFRTKIVSNESTAVTTLKTIHVAAASYQVEHGSYPPSLQELNSSSLVPLDGQLASNGVQSGYQFSYKATQKGYVIHADPVFIHTGQQHFFMDETGVIRSEKDKIASAASEPIAPQSD